MKFSEELNAVISLVIKAGKEVLNLYNKDYDINIKEDNSLLTEADLLSNKIITEGLEKFGYDIISEEKNFDKKDYTKKVWIIDPLDGTKDFIQKTGEFSIMIALLEDRKPILGVVYVPVLDKLYIAEKDKGAFLFYNNSYKMLNINQSKEIEDFKIVVSRNHFLEELRKISLELNIKNFNKMGSVGVKFCSIAEGKSDLALYTNSKMGIWDCASSHIILEEAGGEVLDIYGNNPEYNFDTKKMKNGFVGIGTKDKKVVEKVVKAINKVLGL